MRQAAVGRKPMLADSVSHVQYVAVNLDRLHTRSSRPCQASALCGKTFPCNAWSSRCRHPRKTSPWTRRCWIGPRQKTPHGNSCGLWESPQPMVVVGRSTRVQQEVFLETCRERSIPILRRSSGGAAIVAGPGCLMYAVVLSYALRPELKDIGRAHAFVLQRLATTLQPLVAAIGSVSFEGTSDLVFEERGTTSQPRKFSGNSLRASEHTCCTTARCFTTAI